MERNDDYGLNKNETWIYRMARTILIAIEKEQDVLTTSDIVGAIDESLELGLGRRISNEYNYSLVKARLCNWFDVKNDGLVPMPVDRKAQAEYNKRFGIEE